MQIIDDLIENYVDDFNRYDLEELNENRDEPLEELNTEDVSFDEKAFLNDLLDGDLKLFGDYILNDFEELSHYIDDEEIVDHMRTYDEVTSKGHKNDDRYLEKLPDYDEQQKAYRDAITVALRRRAGGDRGIETFMDDEDIKSCVLDEDLELNFGMSESELITNNTVQMYNCLIYLMGNEVKNKLENLNADDLKDYLSIDREDIKLALEAQKNESRKTQTL